MAPNRKNISSFVETLSSNDLQNLQSTIQPKFLPLTDPKEQRQEASVVEQKAVPSTDSYWDWPANDVEVEKVDLFSASHIVSNLIQDATKVEETSAQTVSAHDDYWAESTSQSQESAPVNKPQHVQVSYWDWAADQDTKKYSIECILAEEKAHKLVSGATTQAVETAAPQRTNMHVETSKVSSDSYWTWEAPVHASYVGDSTHPNNNYWDWKMDQPDTLKSIIEYEVARELLAANNIVSQLQTVKATQGETSCSVQANDEYWTTSESYGDQYWNDAAPAVASLGQGYWDM